MCASNMRQVAPSIFGILLSTLFLSVSLLSNGTSGGPAPFVARKEVSGGSGPFATRTALFLVATWTGLPDFSSPYPSALSFL